jgi:chromosome partitioning protein
MPLVITLAHQKGGVGKSTLATNLRSTFAGSDYKTGLVDIDPQGSLTRLLTMQAGGKPEDLIAFDSYDDLAEKMEAYDIVVIDTPPYLSGDLKPVLGFTDLVLVPCKTSPLDFFAIGDTLDLIREVKNDRPSLVCAIVLSMTISGTDFTKKIRDDLKAASEFPVLKTEVANRIAYMRSLDRADSIAGDDNRKARDEMQSLADELISLLK